jgi:hypothetical protein
MFYIFLSFNILWKEKSKVYNTTNVGFSTIKIYKSFKIHTFYSKKFKNRHQFRKQHEIHLFADY